MSFRSPQSQELNPDKVLFCQLVQKCTDQPAPNTVQPQTCTAFQPPIRVNQLIQLTKDAYLNNALIKVKLKRNLIADPDQTDSVTTVQP